MGSYTVVQRDCLTLSIIDNITAGKLVTPTPIVDDILWCYHLHRTVYFFITLQNDICNFKRILPFLISERVEGGFFWHINLGSIQCP